AGAPGAARGGPGPRRFRSMSGPAFVEYDGASVHASSARPILDRLTLSVAEGEVLALIGRSGSGKTTALRLVNALIRPTGGAVRVAGRATTDWDAISLRPRTGYVIQEI